VCVSFLGTRLLDYCGVYIHVRYCVFVLHLFLRLLLLLLLLASSFVCDRCYKRGSDEERKEQSERRSPKLIDWEWPSL
jgi:hypothetical protein